MKRFFLCFNIFICCTCAMYAQLNLLNISDYERPFITRQALGLNLGSDAIRSFGEGNFITSTEATRNILSVEGRLSYSNYRNSQKYQGTQTAFSRYYNSSNKTTTLSANTPNINSIETTKYHNLHIDIESTNYFYNKKNYFLLGGGNMIYNSASSKETQQFSGVSDIENERKNLNYSASLEVGIGKGRIDPISDVYLAIYLIEALQKNNRLTKELSPEETLDFAQHIAQVKNRRVLDFRLKRIYEMEAIDSFFVENQLIDESDATYFSTLADLLPYGYFPDRHKGSLISFSFIPEYSSTDNIITSNYSSKQRRNQILGKINYRYYRPIKLKYLWTIDASILIGTANYKTEYTFQIPTSTTTTNEGKRQSVIPSFRTSLSYFPNTRTEIKATLSGFHMFEENFENTLSFIAFNNQYLTELSTGLEVSYWFSPNFNLQANYNFFIYQPRYNTALVSFHKYKNKMRGSLSFNYTFF